METASSGVITVSSIDSGRRAGWGSEFGVRREDMDADGDSTVYLRSGSVITRSRHGDEPDVY